MSFLGDVAKTLAAGATGFLTGGPLGAAAGVGMSLLGGGTSKPGSTNAYGPPPGFAQQPQGGISSMGSFQIGGVQINPLAGAPGGVPLFQRAAPQAGGAGFGGNKSLAAAMVLSGQVPAITSAQAVQRMVAPPGYVLVQTPSGPQAMLKELAYALGLKKRPRKSGISRRDIQGAYRVQGFVRKLTTCKPKHPLKKRGKGR